MAGADLAVEQAVQQRDAPVGRRAGVGQQPGQLRLAVQDPAEAEQLVLDVVERAGLLRGAEHGVARHRLQAVRPGRSTRPSRGDRGGDGLQRRPLHLAAEQPLDAARCAPTPATAGSARWRRSAGWPASSRVTANSSSPRRSRSAASTWSTKTSSRALRSASDSRLAAWSTSAIRRPRPRAHPRALGPRRSREPVQLGQERVDGLPAAAVVGQRRADEPLGQLHRQAADLAAELAHGLLALRGQLLLAALADPRGLLLGLLAQLGPDPVALGAGVVADARRLGPQAGQLLLVLPLERGGLLLGLLGPLEAALDPVGALGVDLLELREDRLGQHPQQQQERDRPDDDLDGVRDEGVDLLALRHEEHAHVCLLRRPGVGFDCHSTCGSLITSLAPLRQ